MIKYYLKRKSLVLKKKSFSFRYTHFIPVVHTDTNYIGLLGLLIQLKTRRHSISRQTIKASFNFPKRLQDLLLHQMERGHVYLDQHVLKNAVI